MKWIIFLLIIATMIVGCTQECPDCICPECRQLECPVYEEKVCPETIEPICPIVEPCPPCEENIKYVCPDKKIVSDYDECFTVLDVDFKPIKTNEDGELIKNTSVKPACVVSGNGGALSFNLGTIAKDIEYQIKTSPEEDFETILKEQNLNTGRRDFAIVGDENKRIKESFKLLNNSVYLFRIKFNFETFKRTLYSNEYVIDTRAGSEYLEKKCS